MRHCKALDPKVFVHSKLSEVCDDNPLLNSSQLTQLRSVVNSLGYLASTRPDISSALGTVARGQAAGRKRHLSAAQILVSYVMTKRRKFLCRVAIDESEVIPISIAATFDANLTDDQYSRMGCFVSLRFGHQNCECTVNFKSGLSTTTCLSTCEAELGSSSFCARIVEALRNVIREVLSKSPRYHISSSDMAGDNSAANLISNSSAGIRAVRHLSLQNFFVRSLTSSGKMTVRYINTTENPSDLLTKVLSESILEPFLKMVGLVPM